MKRRPLLIGITLAVAIFAASHFVSGFRSPGTEFYARQKPKTVDLVGVWILADNGVKAGPKGNTRPSLVLQADGKFTLTNIPGQILSDKGSDRIISERGSWYTDDASGDADDHWWELGLNSVHRGDFAMYILSDSPPHTLEITPGAPDGPRYYFQKQTPGNSVK